MTLQLFEDGIRERRYAIIDSHVLMWAQQAMNSDGDLIIEDFFGAIEAAQGIPLTVTQRAQLVQTLTKLIRRGLLYVLNWLPNNEIKLCRKLKNRQPKVQKGGHSFTPHMLLVHAFMSNHYYGMHIVWVSRVRAGERMSLHGDVVPEMCFIARIALVPSRPVRAVPTSSNL